MTTDEMVSIVLDVIDANIEYAPADLAESDIAEWIEAEGWPIYHVHGDDPDVVNVFAGPTRLFGCTRAQFRTVMDRVAGESGMS